MTTHLTIKAAGQRLSVSGSTIRRRIEDGQIRVVNIGRPGGRPKLRVPVDALDEYAAARELEISGSH